MEVFATMVFCICFTLAVQAVVRKIQSARILRAMKKEHKAREEKVNAYIESKKYVTL